MTQVRVKEGEELNGLGLMIKEISVVIRETTSGVAGTLHFGAGEIEMQNDAIEKPTAYQEAGFENLAYISSGQMSPMRALPTGKVRVRGNLLTLLKVNYYLFCCLKDRLCSYQK